MKQFNLCIPNLPIFGRYKKAEDIVTTALMHILQRGGDKMVHWFLTELGADLPDFGVQIYTQKK